MTGPPIAYALASGLKAHEAGAVVDLVTNRNPKWASLLCCAFALLGGVQETGSYSHRPLTRTRAQRKIPAGVPCLGYDFQFDALPALFKLHSALLMPALAVLFFQLPPGFSGANEFRPINRRPAEGPANPRVVSFGHRRRVS